MSYAQASDVEADLGRPASSATETAQWELWLDRVERSIERVFRRNGLVLDDQVALDDPTADDVVDVEVAAVVRKIQNPVWGRTSSTRTIDDASITDRSFEGGGSDSNPLDLTGDEISGLLPAGRKKARAFSILPS